MIRMARGDDAKSIKAINIQIGFVEYSNYFQKLVRIFSDPNTFLVVWEVNGRIASYCSLHFAMDYMSEEMIAIGYFYSLGNLSRRYKIPKAFENRILKIARKRKCRRIEIGCQLPSHPVIYTSRQLIKKGKIYVRRCF